MSNKRTLFHLRPSGGLMMEAALGSPIGNYDVQVASAVDTNLWDVVEIEYIGGQIDLYNKFTIDEGVQKLTDAILSTPGEFALVGMSQGASVCSQVYKKLKTGSLQHRKQDLVAGVMFGNPFREGGHTIPGGTDPGGHGIAADRLIGSEELWWEFADPNDVFAVVGDDAYGQDATATHETLMLNWTGVGSVTDLLTNTIENWATIGTTMQNQLDAVARLLLYVLPSGLTLAGVNDPAVNTFGHLRYHFDYPGLAGTETAVQLAVAYLNDVGTQPFHWVQVTQDRLWSHKSTNRNLEKGQYQIGDLVMGPFTPFKVESIDIGNYDVNVQDYQSQLSNELRFGTDTLKPAPLQLTINVMVNRPLPNIAALTNDIRVLNFDNDPNLADLQREWRAEDIMPVWGALKPLLFCGSDGITRQFYGRPGKFSYKPHKQVDGWYYQCQAEFRRSDTLAYSNTEYYVDFAPDSPLTVTRDKGTATSWLRFLLTGPFANPTVNFGTQQITIDTSLVYPGGVVPDGVVIEISSYPWERRVIDSNGLSLAAYIVTDRPYLDTIQIPYNIPMVTSWTATSLSPNSKMRLTWHDAYQVMDQ